MDAGNPVDYVILPLSPNEFEDAFELANELRGKGKTVDVDLTDRKLGDRFNRASKIADYAVVLGSNEVISQKYVAKNLKTGETVEL
jgi:histidyl-tRNA synthetase